MSGMLMVFPAVVSSDLTMIGIMGLEPSPLALPMYFLKREARTYSERKDASHFWMRDALLRVVSAI